ncbi:hypothetical protein [Herbaspirillum sp. ST 5-3]|uniref:hypothetical protein n=1 Tax=Oxalobacteraceae TaxID=75682 RepID=UPI0010A2C166|nr:hypothetical protein [Herbaspirillum sp. ST 5-3]
MVHERFPHLKPGSSQKNLPSVGHTLALLGPALTAHAVASALTVYAATVPALIALAATLAFAAAWRYGPRRVSVRAGHVSSRVISDLYGSFLAAAATLAGAWAITAVIGDAHAYYCSEAVPWRIEIALFGSFALGLLCRMAEARGLQMLAYPLTLLALFWIAPYYGYFSGPVFLGIGLITDCTDRSVVQLCVAAFGMVAGTAIGRSIAAWLSSNSSS